MLPTNRDVKTFFYHHEVCKKTIRESTKCPSDELMAIWMKARIPTTYQQHIVKEYSLIKKKKGRDSKAQQSRQKDFAEKAHKLFDIAHKDADSLLTISK